MICRVFLFLLSAEKPIGKWSENHKAELPSRLLGDRAASASGARSAQARSAHGHNPAV